MSFFFGRFCVGLGGKGGELVGIEVLGFSRGGRGGGVPAGSVLTTVIDAVESSSSESMLLYTTSALEEEDGEKFGLRMALPGSWSAS